MSVFLYMHVWFTLTVMISSLVLSVDVRDSILAVCPSNRASSSETMDWDSAREICHKHTQLL